MNIIRVKLFRVIFITILWVVFSVLIALFDYATILSVIRDSSSQLPSYNFITALKTNIVGAFLGGILLASIEIFYLAENLRTESFGKVIRIKALFYLATITIISILGSFLYGALVLDLPFYHQDVISITQGYLLNYGLLRSIIIWGVITVATFFFMQINDKFGPKTLWRFVTGKYHKPHEENRIFMFLDLKSSTAIAEKLGNVKYFNFLNEFYSDITNAIIYNKGEIYQYVGDEIVVSWTLKNGVSDSNCLKCFYSIKENIATLKGKYIEKYGITPAFKAGLHFGTATTGEIGVIKKEIAFSGDVMNTTSRIQESCNAYDVDILISEKLQEILPKTNTYSFEELGKISLRGRAEKITLFTVAYTNVSLKINKSKPIVQNIPNV